MSRIGGRTPLSTEEAIKRSRANLRLAASTSFTEAEVLMLDELFRAVRRGGDAKLIARSPAFAVVSRKVQAMFAVLERQRARRAAKDAAESAPPEPIPEIEALLDDPTDTDSVFSEVE